ncbi:hypothetical protein Q3G72_029102 [Acer saccharum]|nr:hypothetical protein Q3G72_012378 [Acer saccharum]KAK1588967.1 hypothetical protein Q3G72_029102 [Acer saccharum]
MENSMNSYMQQKPVIASSRETTTGSPNEDEQEESGWTAYFEDFSNNRVENSFCSSYIDSSNSLVSDAAFSGAAWNNHHHQQLITACSSIGATKKFPKKLKLKKTRTKEICEDDSLEDTASSPANSPKVSDLEPIIDMNHPDRKADHDHMYSSLGKGGASEEYFSQVQSREEIRSMNNNSSSTGKINNDCTDLKRRGLCLVPLSMLVNYYG